MKRKLAILATFVLIGLGKCGQPCFDLRPDYCGIDGKGGTYAVVNNQPRIIPSK
jgi:hypothetical protein